LGTIGRLEKQKGHRFLLSAMKELREHGVETELLLVGSGRAEVALRAQADQLGLAGSVHFLGTRNDLGDLFRAIDLFVMPSLWEGLSLAMLTAMAAGLPVVTTDVGGVLESIGHDERGFVVAPGDASALAAKLAWCLAHPDETQAKASAGAAFVRAHYSDEAMVRRIESVYERVFSLGH
jgi:glycosyltransferase involved in cell wall biosynthesis